jgi:uncharacterized protein GlcG (DUF336 family)
VFRPIAVLLTTTAFATTFVAPASAQQLVQRRDLSYAVALAIATGAVEACKALGFHSSAVAVVDRAGDTLVAVRDDQSRPHAMEAARRKAYTARTFGVTTTEFSKEIPTRPSRREQTLLPNVTALNGGVPIKLGNEVIGGVGVAGSPGKDEECASAGLEKVKAALQ